MTKNDEVISLRGNKELWVEFVNKVRKNRKKTKETVWDIIKTWIKGYIESN